MKGMEERKKVLVAMSGGVDSSVAALMLMKHGYDIMGGTLLLHGGGTVDENGKACGTGKDAEDARVVCEKLGVEHRMFDRRDAFRQNVIGDFVAVYAAGGTPNPCVRCNRTVKFPEMYAAAKALGCDMLATGHYAAVRYNEKTGRWQLYRAANKAKDQSYVLYGLGQELLSHLILPLGDAEDKSAVRAEAEKAGLVNSRKPDSQDICFIPDGDHTAFIERFTGEKEKPCRLVSENGEFFGMGSGISAYTVGQRKGLGITFGEPRFVIDKRAESGEIVVGKSESLFSKTATVGNCNFISVDKLTSPMRVTAKTRYSQREAEAVISPLDDGRVLLEFDEPQRAMARGQSAVFYDGDAVVGGGIIL